MGNCVSLCVPSNSGATSEDLAMGMSKASIESRKMGTIVTANDLYSKDVGLEDFRIEKVIGRGTFGKVFLVQEKSSQRHFAMKTLKKEIIIDHNHREHTKAERLILEKMTHPFIVQLHFAFQTPDKLYFVMDFLNGGELFHHLRKEKRFCESKSRFYACEILLAIEFLHKQGIIYRDLKPENVILGADGHVKLTDFGLSKLCFKGSQKSYTFCGTPEYLAPEIIKQKGHDKAVDWWSFGILLYEMVSGKNPFRNKYGNQRETLAKIADSHFVGQMLPGFSPELAGLLSGLLINDPKLRLGGGSDDAEEIKNHAFFKGV